MKTLRNFIHERRAHADKNPRLSAYDQLLPYKDDPNIYISMTNINKIGINPYSQYETPLGIYTYPLKSVWDEYEISSRKSLSHLPWQGDTKFIQVLRATGKVPDTKTFTESQYNTVVDLMKKHYFEEIQKEKLWLLRDALDNYVDMWTRINKKFGEYIGNKYPSKPVELENLDYYIERAKVIHDDAVAIFEVYMRDLETTVEEFDKIMSTFESRKKFLVGLFDIAKDKAERLKEQWSFEKLLFQAEHHAKVKTPMGKAWNLTRMMAGQIASLRNKNLIGVNRMGAIVHWNKIWRDILGYDGVSDKTGEGIIHQSEPIQAVFFSVKGFQQLDTIRNVDYSEVSIPKIKSLTDLGEIDDLPLLLDMPAVVLEQKGFPNTFIDVVESLLKRKDQVRAIIPNINLSNDLNLLSLYFWLISLEISEHFPKNHLIRLRKAILKQGDSHNELVMFLNSDFYQVSKLEFQEKLAKHYNELDVPYTLQIKEMWWMIQNRAKNNEKL